MKIIIVLFSLILVTNTVIAAEYELDKGAVEIGGELSFSSQSGALYEYDGEGITTFSLSPQFMFFVAPKFALGGVLNYNSSIRGDFSNVTLSVGPGMSYYFGDRDKKMWPFIAGSFIFESFSYGDRTINGTTLHFAGGLAHKLVDHFVLKTGLYYDIVSEKGDWSGPERRSGKVFGFMMAFSGFIY